MKQKKIVPIIVLALIFFLPHYIYSKSNYKYVYSPKTDVYFGHISYTEVKHDGKDPVVIKEGEDQAEVAVLNFPLLPGDTIRTTGSRRCEIQFDTGTIIRLDFSTELKIETILAKCLSTRNKVTNLLLNDGEIYIMYKRYSYPEIFQVATPNASVKMKHRTVAVISAREDGGTDIQVKSGKAYIVYGPSEKNIKEEKIKKSMRVTISKDHVVLQGEYMEDVDFEMWNEWVNKNFEELHEGLTPLPKPIRRFPKAVHYFAQKYSNIYGEWVWSDFYGYVWRPSYNDYYPWGNWSPYLYGQWREVNGQLFWVPEESWGWVPYHLGIWMWNKKHGWVWIPGSAFAPAWAAWDFLMGYYCWRPWSLYDWYFYNSGYLGSYFWPYYYDDYYPYPGYFGDSDEEGKEVLTIIRKNQLKKKQTPRFTMPRELKKIYSNVVSALNRGDERVLSSLRKIPEHVVMVKKEELNAKRIYEKAVSLREISLQKQKAFPSQKSIKDPYREAVRTYRRNEFADSYGMKVIMNMFGKKSKVGTLPNKPERFKVTKKPVSYRDTVIKQIRDFQEVKTNFIPAISKNEVIELMRPPKSKTRFRDWNPDATVARRAGVSIKYSSRTNEVRCPELRLSSGNVSGSRNMVRMTGFSGSGGSSYSGSGVSSSSSSSSGSSGRAISSSSRGSVSSSRGSSGGGSAKKK